MGFIVDKGQTWEKICNSCGEPVQIIGSGADICCCPYCGHTLLDHTCDSILLNLSFDEVQSKIKEFRRVVDPEKKEDLKRVLLNKIYWLYNDLEFYK
jgi:predicted amidophosphoribosyltransferase